jgi:hypothetical protein
MSRTTALKVLDHAMIGSEGAENCQKFVDILGLGRIFPLFIKTPKPHKKAGPNKRELEGELLSTSTDIILWRNRYTTLYDVDMSNIKPQPKHSYSAFLCITTAGMEILLNDLVVWQLSGMFLIDYFLLILIMCWM